MQRAVQLCCRRDMCGLSLFGAVRDVSMWSLARLCCYEAVGQAW
jgi:hypothetical protein